jgi:dipeptidyl aminopeptidase/acylaminoacyl peptidase
MMNKDLLDQIPAEEQPAASKLNSLIDEMQPSQAFQWELENRLMQKATGTAPPQGRFTKIAVQVGWGIAAIAGLFLLNWTVRSLASQPPPAAGLTTTPEVSFAESIRAGDICMGPLAMGHGFAVFLTNPEKTKFVVVDPGNTIGELRSFTWSADGRQLAILGNTTGSGNIYLTNPSGEQLEHVLSAGELGYMMDAAWSRDGKQIAMWSSQNNRVLYLMNADGTALVEKQLNAQILGAPQFWPDGSSLVFYGATPTSIGLFEIILTNTEAALINTSVESASSYAFSPNGSQLAYMEYDRDIGEARLILESLTTHDLAILGTFSIPKGSGSSVPETANMSWSADGKSIVFDVGRGAHDRVIYLANVDGTGLVKLVDAGYAPTISSDGKCLAYINEGQVFLMDLTNMPSSATTLASILLSDLPTGRGTPDFRLDKLKWRP